MKKVHFGKSLPPLLLVTVTDERKSPLFDDFQQNMKIIAPK